MRDYLKLIAEQAEQITMLKAKNERLREALEKLARLGNGDQYGNSIGNEIAQQAIKQTEPGGENE